MKRIAVFAGSFDPVTKGHEAIIRRGLSLFDEVIVAIGVNSSKKYMFSLEQRKTWLEQTFAHEPRVKVADYEGLTVDFCKQHQAGFILRGLRSGIDFDYEKTIAQMNHHIAPGIETVLIITEPAFGAINSSIIRELLKHNQDVRDFIPDAITIE